MTGHTFIGWYNGDTKVESGAWGIASNVTLTPQWEAAKNTITLDANGGTVSGTTVAVTYGVAYTLPTPERTGYIFDGWFRGTTRYTSGTWNEEADVTLVAKWTAKTYNLIFKDAEEKDIVVTFNYNYSGSTSTTVTLKDRDTLSYPSMPSRSGYIFRGWYTDAACTTRFDFTSAITSDLTLYAGWTDMPRNYVYTEVQKDPSEYTSSSDYYSVSTNYTNSSSMKHIYLVAQEAGTHYIYWKNSNSSSYYGYYLQIHNTTTGATLRSASNTYSTSYQYISFSCSKDDIISISIYRANTGYSSTAYFYFAGFKAVTSSAVADASTLEYSAGASISNQITYGASFTLPDMSRTGYRFLGWYNGDNKVEAGAWSIDSNVTLVPRWEIRTNTITLDPNGGTVSSASISVTYGNSYTLPTLTRTGYSFDGWFSGNTQYTSGTWNEEADVTLVAKWTANEYNLILKDIGKKDIVVTFNYNYSGSTSTTVTLKDGDTLSYPSMPSRSGYIFRGWYTDAACTTRFDFTSAITSDLTLYAGWTDMPRNYVYTEVQKDPSEYTSSSDYYSVSTNYTNSSSMKHIYLVAQEAGTHYIYWKNSNSSSYYGYYLQIHNTTTGATLRSASNTYSTSYQYISFSCSKDDIISISIYRANTGYSSTAYFYFAGFKAVTSSAVADASTLEYSAGASISNQITYGASFTLPDMSRTGYRFLGWYNGDTKVESGTWNYDTNLTLTPKWEEIVYYNVTLSDVKKKAIDKVEVTYNYNYSGSTNSVVELSNGDTLTYPTVPTRSGYAFVGWYTDSSCTTRFNFNETITEDITLYAEWYAMQSTYTVRAYVDIANYNTSSSKKSFSNVTSNSTKNYYYFTTYVTGTYTFYANYSSGDYYISLYNATQGTYILNDINFWSGGTTSKSVTYTANAGDIIYVGVYKYSSSSSTGSGTFYVSGASYPTSSAKAQYTETEKIEYSYGNSVTIQVGYGEEFTLQLANLPIFDAISNLSSLM